jgi:CDP-glycerol glycerophosphotransferase (TagB/SpsB family)
MKNKIKNYKSIFLMFTWRNLKYNQKISKYYLKNILKLLKDKLLYNILIKRKVTLYFCLHHMIEQYKPLFKMNKFIKYIKQEQIIDCLSMSDLIITDFSSIIFDIMAKKKPYIIFIPDSEDPNISYIYDENYYNIINCLKNGTINFENRFFKVSDTIEKIIFYINHNFTLESKMKKFYSKFNLMGGNNTKDLINYLKHLN